MDGSLTRIAWFVYSNFWVLSHHSLSRVILNALFSAVLLWAASTLLTFYVYLLGSNEEPRRAIPIAIRSSAPGMWFAPAMLLLSGVSPTSFFVSVLLAVNTARVLVSRWPIRSARVPAAARSILSAVEIRTGFLSRKTLPAFLAAFVILSGVAAKIWHWPLLSASFLVAGTAIITALSLLSGAATQARAPKAPPSAFAILLTILLATTLTVGVFQVRSGDASGEDGHNAPQESATRIYNSGSAKEIFPGVVLKTDVKEQPAIAPHVYLTQSRVTPQPQWIEFSGEYWMLRPSYAVPPPDALVSRTSPLNLIYRTTDAGPMKMEARQKLERPIDLACCSRLQVMIKDADHRAGMIALELILLDRARTLSLGTRVINSELHQTLDFPVPRGSLMRSFDQIEVVFHRDPARIDRSANISIERFVLLPAQ